MLLEKKSMVMVIVMAVVVKHPGGTAIRIRVGLHPLLHCTYQPLQKVYWPGGYRKLTSNMLNYTTRAG